MSENENGKLRAILGLVLIRIVVPAWIITGATFKLMEGNPGLLPREMLRDAHGIGINLDLLLATLVSLEFAAAFVMIFIRHLARLMVIAMMSVFVLVLIREIAAGNTSCGCLGGWSPPPILMLAIDGTMLLGAIFLKPRTWTAPPARLWPWIAALALSGAAAGATFAWLAPDPPAPSPPPPGPGEIVGTNGDESPTEPEPLPLPAYWYNADFQNWIGRHWTQIDLFRLMDRWPQGLNEGKRYVVFFSRTCDHCETLFRAVLAPDPGLARQVTAVEIPTGEGELRGADAWAMPDTECEHLHLPLGVNWIISPPLALRIEDGIVTCAEEGEALGCLEMQ